MIQLFTKACIAATLASFATAAPLSPIQQVIGELQDSSVTTYSSDLTRDIFIKKIHSHNDYWRDIPLFTALSNGVQSVEADVWWFSGDDNLYVGHHEAALNTNRTFQSLYVNPLKEILDKANPHNQLTENEKGLNGVFDTQSSATLYFFVDVKTDGNLTWSHVISALEPLREAGYLTYFNGTDIVPGPVTVIGTGNTPLEFVASRESRDYFYDGPLNNLTDDFPITLNPIASASLASIIDAELSEIPVTGLNETQFTLLKDAVSKAHSKGIMTRVWEVSWWPIQKRNALYRQLVEAESDFLNADDLEWISKFV